MNKSFIGKSYIQNQINNGLNECLIGFILEERGIPRQGYKILNSKGMKIGGVTSGTMSPLFKKGFGMGYVLINESQINSDIFIVIRNQNIKAKIVKRPFI